MFCHKLLKRDSVLLLTVLRRICILELPWDFLLQIY